MGISHITAKWFRPKADSVSAGGELWDPGPLLSHSEPHPHHKWVLNIHSRAGSVLSTGVIAGLALPLSNGPLKQNRLYTSKQMNDYKMQSALEGTNGELAQE